MAPESRMHQYWITTHNHSHFAHATVLNRVCNRQCGRVARKWWPITEWCKQSFHCHINIQITCRRNFRNIKLHNDRNTSTSQNRKGIKEIAFMSSISRSSWKTLYEVAQAVQESLDVAVGTLFYKDSRSPEYLVETKDRYFSIFCGKQKYFGNWWFQQAAYSTT